MNLKEKIPIIFICLSKHNSFLVNTINDYILRKSSVPVNQFMPYGYDNIDNDLLIRGNNNLIITADELWVFGTISNEIATKIILAMEYQKYIRFYKINKNGTVFEPIMDPIDLVFETDVLSGLSCDDFRLRIKRYLTLLRVNESGIEIERKWILKEVPSHLKLLSTGTVEQTYLSVDVDVRIRKLESEFSTSCFMDVKGKGGLVREEVTKKISLSEYDRIRKIVEKNPITKEYYRFDIGLNNVLEVSVVDPGTEKSFIYAEIEFDNQKMAEKYNLPIPGAIDVTCDPEFKMKNYWSKTR
jgi:CYTH domain-containing protein